MKCPSIVAAAAALTFVAAPCGATSITSAYTPLGANAWLVDFTVANDGNPSSFAGFTVNIPNAVNLVLRASPITWDSLVFQPAPGIPDDAAFDSFAIAASNRLAPGQSIGGFQISFTFSPGVGPSALPFLVYDDAFAPLAAGMTTVTAVPEPATMLLTTLGLTVVGLRARRTASTTRRTADRTDRTSDGITDDIEQEATA